MSLLDLILAVRGHYRAKMEDDEKTAMSLVANVGLKKGQKAFRHKKGDYYRFAVRALEDIPPLLTHLRVAQAERALNRGNVSQAAEILTVADEFNMRGEGVVFGVMATWLKACKVEIPESYAAKAEELPKALKDRIFRKKSDTLPYRVQIVDVGAAEDGNTPVVPEEWLDREFRNGFELRKAIDGLPSRQGLPEATYCCHYGLKVIDETDWCERNEVESDWNPEFGLHINFRAEEDRLVTRITSFVNGNALGEWLDALPSELHYKRHQGPGGARVLIACDREGLTCEPPAYVKAESVGVLSSRMQKCLRRGRGAAQLLERTLRALGVAPSYSLPDQKFQRTSASRQFVWRLFISIFEDVEPYEAAPEGEYLSLPDLVCLSILAHADPDLQFSEAVREKLIQTALLVQRNDDPGKNWRRQAGLSTERITGGSPIEQACALAVEAMPMMGHDAQMLREGCSQIGKKGLQFPMLPKLSREELLGAMDGEVEMEALLASNDHHCMPQILLYLQGSLPFIPHDPKAHTTQSLSRFIWEDSSRINTRNPDQPSRFPGGAMMLETLRAIQKSLLDPGRRSGKSAKAPHVERTLAAQPELLRTGSNRQRRTGFLSLFGRSFNLRSGSLKKTVAVIVAGTPEEPCRVKYKNTYLEGEERFQVEREFVESIAAKGGEEVELPDPPSGYRWNADLHGKVRTNLHIAGSDEASQRNEVRFEVDGIAVPAFDANPLMTLIDSPEMAEPTDEEREMIRRALYLDESGGFDHWELNESLRAHAGGADTHPGLVLDWLPIAKNAPLPAPVWQRCLTKLHNCFNQRVEIGPVDRRGDSQYAAVDYLYEGTLWRLFNLLAFLYPECLKLSGRLRFQFQRNNTSYEHLTQCLSRLAFPSVERPVRPQDLDAPRIKTPLWDHQQETADRMLEGLVVGGQLGFGDASCVGAGKTLTALEVMCGLFEESQRKGDGAVDGFLVLVATIPLIETWRDEIVKHTSGFGFVTQDASGKLSGEVQVNTIVVTTLGRIRDTPINRRWQLVVIDECLAVQNQQALQTQEAWRQVMCSRHGVLMLSATFFRSRFDKLFYMLKMLRSGLPEKRDYLDTILSEAIACNLPQGEPWRWTTQENRFSLTGEAREKYDQLLALSREQSKALYGKIDRFLMENFDYLAAFRTVLDERLKPDDRALIYARSKDEADRLAAAHPGEISRFPCLDRRHVVASFAEATYGVNTLVCCNVIVMRPPEPDKLPQIKGRLARPGQVLGKLRIEYILVGDTIEEAGILRLERAHQFHSHYIMPLAEFYQLALKRPAEG